MDWVINRIFNNRITTVVGLGCVGLSAVGVHMQGMDGMVDIGKILQGTAMLIGGLANILSRD